MGACFTQARVLIVRFVILYVMARDEDEGENGRVSYRIQAGNNAGRFSLNPNTGETRHNVSCHHTLYTSLRPKIRKDHITHLHPSFNKMDTVRLIFKGFLLGLFSLIDNYRPTHRNNLGEQIFPSSYPICRA